VHYHNHANKQQKNNDAVHEWLAAAASIVWQLTVLFYYVLRLFYSGALPPCVVFAGVLQVFSGVFRYFQVFSDAIIINSVYHF
jgi:hypothetical protein